MKKVGGLGANASNGVQTRWSDAGVHLETLLPPRPLQKLASTQLFSRETDLRQGDFVKTEPTGSSSIFRAPNKNINVLNISNPSIRIFEKKRSRVAENIMCCFQARGGTWFLSEVGFATREELASTATGFCKCALHHSSAASSRLTGLSALV